MTSLSLSLYPQKTLANASELLLPACLSSMPMGVIVGFPLPVLFSAAEKTNLLKYLISIRMQSSEDYNNIMVPPLVFLLL